MTDGPHINPKTGELIIEPHFGRLKAAVKNKPNKFAALANCWLCQSQKLYRGAASLPIYLFNLNLIDI